MTRRDELEEHLDDAIRELENARAELRAWRRSADAYEVVVHLQLGHESAELANQAATALFGEVAR